jgi:hypothetical protein
MKKQAEGQGSGAGRAARQGGGARAQGGPGCSAGAVFRLLSALDGQYRQWAAQATPLKCEGE